jgi:hypothetical protein
MKTKDVSEYESYSEEEHVAKRSTLVSKAQPMKKRENSEVKDEPKKKSKKDAAKGQRSITSFFQKT